MMEYVSVLTGWLKTLEGKDGLTAFLASYGSLMTYIAYPRLKDLITRFPKAFKDWWNA